MSGSSWLSGGIVGLPWEMYPAKWGCTCLMRECSAYHWWWWWWGGLAEMQKLPPQHLVCLRRMNSACCHAHPHQEHLAVDGFVVSIHLGRADHADGDSYFLLASDREVAVADTTGTTAASANPTHLPSTPMLPPCCPQQSHCMGQGGKRAGTPSPSQDWTCNCDKCNLC